MRFSNGISVVSLALLALALGIGCTSTEEYREAAEDAKECRDAVQSGDPGCNKDDLKKRCEEFKKEFEKAQEGEGTKPREMTDEEKAEAKKLAADCQKLTGGK